MDWYNGLTTGNQIAVISLIVTMVGLFFGFYTYFFKESNKSGQKAKTGRGSTISQMSDSETTKIQEAEAGDDSDILQDLNTNKK